MKRTMLALLGCLVCSGLATLAQDVAASGQDKQQIQTVLFVCEHGSAKSVIAAAHFNRLAEQRNPPYRAIARGINPDPEIPQQVRLNLAKDGLDVATWKPQVVAEKDVREATRVVTFGCKLPFFREDYSGQAGGLEGRTIHQRRLRTRPYDYRG